MQIRKDGIQPIQHDLRDSQDKLAEKGQERVQDSVIRQKDFTRGTRELARQRENQNSLGKDSVQISQEAQVRGKEERAERRQHIDELRERYRSGKPVVTPERLQKAAENILRPEGE